MPPAVVKGWKQLLDLLNAQQVLISQEDSPAARRQRDLLFESIKQQLDALASSEAVPPRAAWKTIIRELEVPRQLATLCCKHQLTSSAAATAAWPVWGALHTFVTAAVRDIFHHTSNAASSAHYELKVAKQDDANALQGSVVQQLQQAGLFEHCVTTMRAAAQMLQADADAMAAVTASPAAAPAASTTTAQGPNMQVRGDGDSNGRSIDLDPVTASSKVPQISNMLSDVAFTLLTVQQVDTPGWCATLGAAAGLVVAAARHMDAMLGRVSGVPKHYLLESLTRTLGNVMGALSNSGRNLDLLTSPSVRSAVCLAVLLEHTRSLLPSATCSNSRSSNSRNSNISSSNSGSCGGSSSDTWEQQAVCAWEIAQQLDQEQQGVAQPLLQALGVSTQALVLMVSADDLQNCTLKITAAAAAIVHELPMYEADMPSGRKQDAQQQQQQQQQPQVASAPGDVSVKQQQEGTSALIDQPPQLLVRLLLLAVLRQREQQQRDSTRLNTLFAAACTTAIVLNRASRNPESGYVLQNSSQLSGLVRSESSQVLCSWLDDVMPIVVQLLSEALQETDAVLAASLPTPAAASSHSNSSAPQHMQHPPHSSRSTSSAPLPVPQQTEPVDTRLLRTALQTWVGLLIELGKQCGYNPVLSRQGEASSSREALPVPKVWRGAQCSNKDQH